MKSVQGKRVHITSFSSLITNPYSEVRAIIESIGESAGVWINKPQKSAVENIISPSLYRSRTNKSGHSQTTKLIEWTAALEQGELPKLDSFQNVANEDILSYEHANRFSEYLGLDQRF